MPNKRESMQLLEEASEKYEQAKALHESALYEQAVELLEQALKTNEIVLGKYHKSTIKTYWRIGRSQIHVDGGVSAALVAFKRAIRTCELSYGRDHTATKTLREDIVKCLDQAKTEDVGTNSSHSSSCGGDDDDDSQPVKPESRGSNMSVSNSSSVKDLVRTPQGYMETIDRWLQYEQEGDLMCKRRKYPQAVSQYRLALEMEENVFGGINNMDCADIMCKLACLYRQIGETDKSEELYRKALAMFEATLGQDHPATRGAASHLRHLTKDQGQQKAQTWWGKTSGSFRRKQLDMQS